MNYFNDFDDIEQRVIMSEALSNPNSLNSIAKEAFEVADKDSNGYIDKEEFELCLRNVLDFFGPMETQKTDHEFERLDTDKNGIIDFEEFKKYVKEIIERILSI